MGSKFLTCLLSVPLLIAPSFVQPTEDVQLVLPVRILDGGATSLQPDKNDFRLTINGQPREILALNKRSKSLGDIPDLGRKFVLSFLLTEYGENVENGLSYFISEILTTSDALTILTPYKAYQMNISTNKEKLRRSIEALLTKDCGAYRKERAAAENRLKSFVASLKSTLSTETTGVTQYKKISQFLNTFPGDLVNFKNRYLLPQTGACRQVLDSLGEGEGERWWVHFQQKETLSLFDRLKDVVVPIKRFISGEEINNQDLALILNTGLTNLEQQITVSDLLPAEPLARAFLNSNISYNVIFFRSPRSKNIREEYTVWSDLSSQLSEVSRPTGGRTVNVTNSLEGLSKIQKGRDIVYELVFPWNGRHEEKDIRVDFISGNRELSYCPHFSEAEVRSLVRFLSTPKIKIEDVSVEAKTLSFRVNSFILDSADKFGLLMIRLELWDRDGVDIKFRDENTVRASQQELGISLPLEDMSAGTFKLRITACDLMANRMTRIDRLVSFE